MAINTLDKLDIVVIIEYKKRIGRLFKSLAEIRTKTIVYRSNSGGIRL